MADERANLMERARAFVFGRQSAYQHTFQRKNEANQLVLSDLAKFCRANEPTFHMDARAHALAEGRREVWLRIQNHLNLNSEELWAIYERKGN